MAPAGRWVRAAHTALSAALALGLLLHRTGEAGTRGGGGRGRAGAAPPPGAGGGRTGMAAGPGRDTGCGHLAAARGCPEGGGILESPFSASPLSFRESLSLSIFIDSGALC